MNNKLIFVKFIEHHDMPQMYARGRTGCSMRGDGTHRAWHPAFDGTLLHIVTLDDFHELGRCQFHGGEVLQNELGGLPI